MEEIIESEGNQPLESCSEEENELLESRSEQNKTDGIQMFKIESENRSRNRWNKTNMMAIIPKNIGGQKESNWSETQRNQVGPLKTIHVNLKDLKNQDF